ncbi:MAG: hypothetical protein UF067_10300, partial [Paludibacteraceae bacterium]|nr:hypothetical protein [Paludibacteraceae bacterium]
KDNCEVAVLKVKIGEEETEVPTDGTHTATFDKGSHTVLWTVTDVNGKSSECEQTVKVEDNEAPTIACEAKTVSTDAGKCSANVTLTPEVSDNCGIQSVNATLDGTAVTLENNTLTATLDKGTHTVIWTVTDGVNAPVTCTQTVTVKDNEAPTLENCGSNISKVLPAGKTEFTPDELGITVPTAKDNCSFEFTVSRSDGMVIEKADGKVSGDNFGAGSVDIVWTVTDGVNEPVTCTQKVQITGGNSPAITCPEALTMQTVAGECYGVQTDDVKLTVPTANETVTWTVSRSDGKDISYSGDNVTTGEIPKEGIIVTWVAKNDLGYEATCTQKVTVEDKENPVISGISNIKEVSCDGNPVSKTINLTVTDNCAATLTLKVNGGTANNVTIGTDGKVSYTGSFPVGTTTLTWTATDGVNNTEESQNVTVEDGKVKLPAIDEYKYCADKKLDNGTLKSYIETGLTGKVSYTNLEIVSFMETEAEFKVTNKFGCAATGKLALTKLSLPAAPKTDFTYCPEADITKELLQSEMVKEYDNASDYEIKVENVSGDKYSYIVKNGETNCSTSGEFNVNRYKKPYAPKLSVENFCEGTEGTLSGSTYNVVWKNSTAPALGTDVKAGPYNYSYTYTDGNGCKVDSSLTFKVYAKAYAPKLSVENFCEGTEGTLSGSTDNVEWKTTAPALGADVKADTYKYSYTYTDGNGCKVDSVLTFKVYAKPTAPTVTIDPFCENLAAESKPSLPVSKAGKFEGYTINWTEQYPEISDLKASGSPYTYKYKVTDGNNCESTETSFTVTVHATPVISVADHCLGSNGVLSIKPAASATNNFVWTDGKEPVLDGSIAGDHSYGYTYTDKNNCVVSGTLTYKVGDYDAPEFANVEFCVNATDKPSLPTTSTEGFKNYASVNWYPANPTELSALVAGDYTY